VGSQRLVTRRGRLVCSSVCLPASQLPSSDGFGNDRGILADADQQRRLAFAQEVQADEM